MNGLTALGDPTRQRIVEMLAEGDLSAGEISQRFDISAPAISQHLKVLKKSGLVNVRIDGQRRIYQLCPDGFEEMANWLNRIRPFWSSKLDALAEQIEKAKQQDERENKNNE